MVIFYMHLLNIISDGSTNGRIEQEFKIWIVVAAIAVVTVTINGIIFHFG